MSCFLIWMVLEMGGTWLSTCCFVGCCFQDLFNIACIIIVQFPSTFFSKCFVSINVVHPESSIDTTTALKKSCFISSDRSDLPTIINLLIAVHTFAKHILTSLLVDETLLSMNMNLSTNFRGLPYRMEIASSQLKHMYSVMFAFTWISSASPVSIIISAGYHLLFAFFSVKPFSIIRSIDI